MSSTSQGDLFGHEPQSKKGKAQVAGPPAPAPAGPPTITLIDASGFIFRAYHALPGLTTSRGVGTHAVLGFTRMLLKLLRERQPAYVALCFDRNSRKGRLAIDPNYKATRADPPPDLFSQVDLIRKVAANRTVLMVEHNMNVVADLSDTITVLARGSVLAEGPYAQVSKDPLVLEAYVGSTEETAA